MLEELLNAIAKHIAGGGPGVAWALVAYLLWRLHQLTDRQHDANLETVKALATIRAMLVGRFHSDESE